MSMHLKLNVSSYCLRIWVAEEMGYGEQVLGGHRGMSGGGGGMWGWVEASVLGWFVCI
jgi:hypothetical protein